MDIGNLQVRVALAGVAESIAGLTALQTVLKEISASQMSPTAPTGFIANIKGMTSAITGLTAPFTGLMGAIAGVTGAFGIFDAEIHAAKFAISAYSDARALEITAQRMIGKEAGEAFYQSFLEIQKTAIMDTGAMQKFALSMIGNKLDPDRSLKLTTSMQDVFAAGGFVNMAAANQALWQVTEMLDEGKLSLRHLRSLLRGAPGLLKWIEEAGGYKGLQDFTGSKSITSEKFLAILEQIAQRPDVKGAAKQMADELPDLKWQQMINNLKIAVIPLGKAMSESIIPILQDLISIIADPLVVTAIKAAAIELKAIFTVIRTGMFWLKDSIQGISAFIKAGSTALLQIFSPITGLIASIKALIDQLNHMNGNDRSNARPITAADRARAAAVGSRGALVGA